MTWNNQAKNTAVFTNQALGSESLTWDQDNLTWDQSTGTWNDPQTWANQAKNSSSFTNQTKN